MALLGRVDAEQPRFIAAERRDQGVPRLVELLQLVSSCVELLDDLPEPLANAIEGADAALEWPPHECQEQVVDVYLTTLPETAGAWNSDYSVMGEEAEQAGNMSPSYRKRRSGRAGCFVKAPERIVSQSSCVHAARRDKPVLDIVSKIGGSVGVNF